MIKQVHIKSFGLVTLLVGYFSVANAQLNLNNTREGENVEYCKQHTKFAELMQKEGFKQQYISDQQHLKSVENQLKNTSTAKRVTYYIPIVFHVLHIGGAENISDEQIIDAVEILNRDYSLQNADANTVQPEFNASNPNRVAQPANIDIQFRLATKAPDGTCFNGITRTFNVATNNGDGDVQIQAIKDGNNVYRGEWRGDQYLNVFVVNNANGAAGYTYYPSTWFGNKMENGIWILNNYLGRIGTSSNFTSRALTHEVGHWLNLAHVWGSTNDPGLPENCSTDDEVDDTPNTIGVKTCKLQENTCGPKANVENYMDYSYCSKMFTEGQRDRMRAALLGTVGGRNNIMTAANLTLVGATGDLALCSIDFSASKRNVCRNSSVTFSDKSYNNIQTRIWEFEGGTPATSTDKYPVVNYATPGIYKVKLTVSDGVSSLSKEEISYIVVQDESFSLPFYEGFENYQSTADLTKYEIVNGDEESTAWELNTQAAYSGSKSLYLKNFKQNGDLDEFISPTLDLSHESMDLGGVTLSFRYAAAQRYSGTSNEKLRVYISKDCGSNFILRKSIEDTSLTKIIYSGAFIPTASDWKTVHMTNITTSYFSPSFKFKFAYESSGGNNVYLDDINLYRGAPSNEVVLSTSTLSSNIKAMNVYPNPAGSELNVSFSAMNSRTFSVQIIDVVGKIIATYQVNANEGMNEVLIDTDHIERGSYFVRVSDNITSKTMQFVKQ
jgi:PKD repeat protein